jgi:hypothetical protein
MLAVVVSFFSPCGYQLPKDHFASTINWLLGEGANVVVTQATLPGQDPLPVPDGVLAQRVYADADVMFAKENLWNLGASLVPEADKLVFLDADVRIDGDWLNETDSLLNETDICQPFEFCHWLDQRGRIVLTKPSVAAYISKGLAPWLGQCHVGFSWAMRRGLFEELGGFYELGVRGGGGDAAFAFSLSGLPETERIIELHANADRIGVRAPSYKAYRENALRIAPKVGVRSPGLCLHMWHGERENRQYITREQYFPVNEDGESPVYRREDGLLKWAADAPLALQYFQERKEDG